MARRARGDSLASNMASLTLMAVVVAVAAISLAALGGVFELASDQATSRQVAYRQAVNAEVAARFDAGTRVLDRLAQVVLDPSAEEINRNAIASQYDSGIEYIDRLILARPDGSVMTAYPTFRAPRTVAGEAYFDGDVPEEPSFVYLDDEDSLWVRRKTIGPLGPIVLLARVRTSFLDVLLDGFSSTSTRRIVFIADGQTVLVSGRAGVTLDTDSLVYRADQTGTMGSVSALTTSGEMLSGQFEELSAYSGISWRVSVLEPRSSVLAATWSALVPAVLALGAAALISFVLVWVFARRLVAPLRDLEISARRVAAGSYVRPIESARTDEVGRLAEAFNDIALRLNALHDLSRLLASSASVAQVLDRVIDSLGHIVGSAGVGVFLVDESGRSLCLERARGVDTPVGLCVPLSTPSWLTAALAAQGPASFAGSEQVFASAIPGLGEPGSDAGLTAPLRLGDEAFGVIVIVPHDSKEFTEAEIDMVRTFSAQAAVAINISKLFAEESEARRHAETMREVAETLSSPRDLEHALTGVMRRARDILGVDEAIVAFMDRPSLGLLPAEDVVSEHTLLGAWEAAWAAGDGDSVLRAVRGEDPAVDRFLAGLAAEEVLFLTVLRGGEPAVVVAFTIGSDNSGFGAQERNLLDSMGTEIGLAVDNAFHFAQAESRAANLETVFRISQAVSSSLQIKVVLNRVLDVVQKIFTADAVSLMQYDETKRVVGTAMARGIISAEILHFECEPGRDIPGQVFSSGEPLKIDDIIDADSAFAAAAYRQGMRSLLSVPLLARGRSLGVLTVMAGETEAFSEEDKGLLHTFASQAALAIDTAAMYGKEHHVSSVLQESILPRSLPEYDEVEGASVYLAAGQEAEIGGDYFDMFRAPDDAIVLAIGDVCGKGVTAATKTSMIKYSVRGLIAAGLGPARAMAEVNNMVAESGDTSEIVTLWLGALDMRTGRLRHANGGHPPALLLHDGGQGVTRLETTGPLLGAIADARYDEIETVVAAGDVVLAYTDGVTEARRGNKFFGEGRVRRALLKGGSATEIVDRLLESLDHFVPGNLRDDAAVLAVRIRDRKES